MRRPVAGRRTTDAPLAPHARGKGNRHVALRGGGDFTWRGAHEHDPPLPTHNIRDFSLARNARGDATAHRNNGARAARARVVESYF